MLDIYICLTLYTPCLEGEFVIGKRIEKGH